MTNQRPKPSLPDEAVRAYAAGEVSWRDIRERTGVEDFAEMLIALGRLDLRLPRAPIDRPSRAKEWMREILAEQAQGV